MSELAFNLNGEPFDLPPVATGWRVRKFKSKGAPEVVYGREGTPLMLPIDADINDLRREARVEGRYRLDAVDDGNRIIAGAPPAYVCIHPVELAATAEGLTEHPDVSRIRSAPPLGADAAVIEAMRVNSELARMVVEKIPVMLESAAVLIRAADGAGMPARPLRPLEVVEVEEDEEDETSETEASAAPSMSAPQGGWAFVGRVVEKVAPDVMRAVLSGQLKVPGGLGAMLDAVRITPSEPNEPAITNVPPVVPAPGRRVPAPAASSRPRARQPGGSTPVARSAPSAAPPPADDAIPVGLPTLDTADMAHFTSILGAFTQREQMYAQALLAELSPVQMRAWVGELKQLSVADAVDRIRAVLGVAEQTAADGTDANAGLPPAGAL